MHQGENSADGEERSDSRHILMTEVPTEFSDELDIKCERNRGTKSGPRDFSRSSSKMHLTLTELRKIQAEQV